MNRYFLMFFSIQYALLSYAADPGQKHISVSISRIGEKESFDTKKIITTLTELKKVITNINSLGQGKVVVELIKDPTSPRTYLKMRKLILPVDTDDLLIDLNKFEFSWADIGLDTQKESNSGAVEILRKKQWLP